MKQICVILWLHLLPWLTCKLALTLWRCSLVALERCEVYVQELYECPPFFFSSSRTTLSEFADWSGREKATASRLHVWPFFVLCKMGKTFEINGDGKLCKPLCAWHCSLYAFLCAPDGPPQIWTQNQIILSQHFSRSQVLRSKKDTQKVKLLQESQCILSKITQNVSSSHAFFSDLLKSKSASVSSSLGPLLYLYRMEILEPASFQETGSVSYLFSFLLSRILASPLQPPATKYLKAQLLSLWYPTIWHL